MSETSMSFYIGNRQVGGDEPALLVAELSANHGGKLDRAIETVRAARKAGADAIKLQTYTPDTMTLDCDSDCFVVNQGTPWDGRKLYSLYEEAHTPWEWHSGLQEVAEEEGLIFFSTAFDSSSVDFLEQLGAPCYKIASFEITDIPLIEYAASKKKPIILSTGIATSIDIEDAVDACRRGGASGVAILKCTSSYPTPLAEANLRTVPDLTRRFGCVVGISDHTLGISVPVAATALGAKIIEKHFTLDRKLGGPDSAFSLEPAEFSKMVSSVREVESALGRVTYELSEETSRSRQLSRSLFVVKDVAEGEELTSENVRSIRPGSGMPPKFLKEVLGRKARRAIERGTPLSRDMFA